MDRRTETTVIDHCLPAQEFTQLQSLVMSPDFPWYYSRKTRDDEIVDDFYLYGWLHVIFNEGYWHTHNARPFQQAINYALTRIGEARFEVIRARLVLNTISPHPAINGAHVDRDEHHRTMLLYINDADGDTILFNQFLGDGTDEFSVHQTIKPMANRLVGFDGFRYHSGTLPISTARRVVLNVNYRPL